MFLMPGGLRFARCRLSRFVWVQTLTLTTITRTNREHASSESQSPLSRVGRRSRPRVSASPQFAKPEASTGANIVVTLRWCRVGTASASPRAQPLGALLRSAGGWQRALTARAAAAFFGSRDATRTRPPRALVSHAELDPICAGAPAQAGLSSHQRSSISKAGARRLSWPALKRPAGHGGLGAVVAEVAPPYP